MKKISNTIAACKSILIGSFLLTSAQCLAQDPTPLFELSQPESQISGSAINVETCDSYYWPLTGIIYTSSGIYPATVESSTGSDSTVSLALTVNHSIERTDVVNACGTYLWDVNNQIYTSSGWYTEIFTASNGCDSVVHLDLTISELDIMPVYLDAVSLFAVNNNWQEGVTYQWYNCSLKQEVPGATGQLFVPSENGNYAVISTAGACVDTSLCYLMYSLGLEESDQAIIAEVFPNPTSGSVNLRFAKSWDQVSVTVYDLVGNMIQRTDVANTWQTTLDIDAPAGHYFLEIHAGESAADRIRVIKL